MSNQFIIIDAHAHLWEELKGNIGGQPVRSMGGGRALFKGETRQMMPAYMTDGRNTAEMFISNMDYAGVAAAVVTQEYIDGDQNDYLLAVRKKYSQRFRVCGLVELREPGYAGAARRLIDRGFTALKFPAQWLTGLSKRVYLTEPEMMESFKLMEERGVILSIDLAGGEEQVPEMREVIAECPGLKVAIGHFGMVNRPRWESQIKLAEFPNVMIESGGITWLYHKEFYPYTGAVRAVRQAAQMVGIEKLMWGSDYPRTMTAITYTMSYDFFLKTKDLTEVEKELFLGGNAVRFYQFQGLKPVERIKNMVED